MTAPPTAASILALLLLSLDGCNTSPFLAGLYEEPVSLGHAYKAHRKGARKDSQSASEIAHD
ncbi:MAG: hypothetical protein ACLGJA_15285 [Gammaproteobacteria bacterium]|jgi:hypothetical protein|uniref:hypothetical protein n=1 Tax=Pseudomonas urmiensis TaxID=2745493 RepID=UPI0039F999CE